jgi:hypothetical protein
LFLRPGRWRMGLGSWRGKSYCQYFILKAFERNSTMTDVKANASDSSVGSRLLFSLFIVVLLSFGAYAMFVSAPATRANAKIQLDREIAAENLAFCEKFGIRADTSDFGVCSQQLAIVRQEQADRDSAAAAGLP